MCAAPTGPDDGLITAHRHGPDTERLHLLDLFPQAPGFVCFMRGRDFVFERAVGAPLQVRHQPRAGHGSRSTHRGVDRTEVARAACPLGCAPMMAQARDLGPAAKIPFVIRSPVDESAVIMPLSPGPYFFVLFGAADTTIPLAISPVERYKAPDGPSSWTALGIHGYVLNYNERLANINKVNHLAYEFGQNIEHTVHPETLKYFRESFAKLSESGLRECQDYANYLAETHDSLVAGCAKLKVPLPRHGKTTGMKPVYTPGMFLPPGSWPAE